MALADASLCVSILMSSPIAKPIASLWKTAPFESPEVEDVVIEEQSVEKNPETLLSNEIAGWGMDVPAPISGSTEVENSEYSTFPPVIDESKAEKPKLVPLDELSLDDHIEMDSRI